jgi:hypothetical protein
MRLRTHSCYQASSCSSNYSTHPILHCPPSPARKALAPHENLIEVHVSEVTLSAAAELPPDASTFVAWDFFLHDSQATPVLPGHNPCFNTTGDTRLDRAA